MPVQKYFPSISSQPEIVILFTDSIHALYKRYKCYIVSRIIIGSKQGVNRV